MILFIMTRGRVTAKEQVTLPMVRDQQYRLVMVVPICEKEKWETFKGSDGKGAEGLEFHYVPDEWRAPQIRQNIVEHFSREDKKHVVFDDDVTFLRRFKAGQHPKYEATRDDVSVLLDKFDRYLEDYAYAGVAPIESDFPGLNVERGYSENGRIMRINAYDAEVLMCEGIRYNTTLLNDDFHVILSLLELGYCNVIDYEFVQAGTPTNAPGGCTLYRTFQMQVEEAEVFKKLHPKFVKTSIVAGNKELGGKRVRFDIAWKRALGCREHERKMPI